MSGWPGKAAGYPSARPTRRSPRPTARSKPGGGRRTTRSAGWYGLRNGYRGRFGMYLPPLLEELGLAEVSHDARNNRMRAI